MEQHRDGRGNHPRLDGHRRRAIRLQRAPGVLQRYAEISSPPSTLMTFPVIQSAPGWDSATIAPPRSAGAGGRGGRVWWAAMPPPLSVPANLPDGAASLTTPPAGLARVVHRRD